MDKAIVFFGWSLRLFLSAGCLKSNGVILTDMVERLGTTNSVVGWAFSLQHGVSHLVGPLVSLLLRVFTRRQVAVLGGCLVGTSYIYCGLYLESVWQLFFAYTVSGVGLGFNMIPGYLNFCEHFHDNLGTALSAASLCTFLGLATLPLFLQYLKSAFGVDNGLLLFGDFLLNFVVSAFAVSKPVKNLKQIQAVEAKHLVKEETCPFTKANDADKNEHVNEEKSNLQRYFQDVCAMFNHENLAVFMALEGLMVYIFVSWGLFLVSVGTSKGLSPDQAVLLSFAGGIGGFFGKLVAVELFRTGRMDEFTSTFFPLLCNTGCFIGCAFARSFYLILLFTFVSGACIGVNSSGLFGLLPTMVCKPHLQQAFVTASFIEGIAMQLAGFTSGVISDITGSATNVFVFNAILSISGLPLVLRWSCRRC